MIPFRVAATWTLLGHPRPTSQDLVTTAAAVDMLDALTVLIRFIRYSDSTYGGSYEGLSRQIVQLSATPLGLQVKNLLTNPTIILFNRWQLLFAIKLVCLYGTTGPGNSDVRVPPDSLLELFLKINDFIDKDDVSVSSENTDSLDSASVWQTVLKEHFLFSGERPQNLVGRYYNLVFERAASDRKADFDNWVNLDEQSSELFGVLLLHFAAILFAFYSKIPVSIELRDGKEVRVMPPLRKDEAAHPFFINPNQDFRNVAIPAEQVRAVVEKISCTPEEIKLEHHQKYGEDLGKLFDVTYLVQHPVIKLKEDRYAALSHNHIIQRLSQGLFWDIHDGLPSHGPSPSRDTMNSFWGRLVEQYGTDLLRRLVQKNQKVSQLIVEEEYMQAGEKTTDAILIEREGKDVCTLIEFTVGRPRLLASLIPGDLDEFQKDLDLKLGSALDQQLDLLSRLSSNVKLIPGLDVERVKRWLICLVVADPYPAYEELLTHLRDRMSAAKLPDNCSGPFVMSLHEMEQLEAISGNKRLSSVILEWAGSTYGSLPFSFFAEARARNSNTTLGNEFLRACSDRATYAWGKAMFPEEASQLK